MESGHEDRGERTQDAAETDAVRAPGVRRQWPTTFILVGLFCGFVIAGLVYKVGDARDVANRSWCTCKGGGQLRMALWYYHADYGSFPPVYIADSDGRPIHSWRALVLPYISPELAARYSFDEPWNGPNNSKLFE